METVEKPSETLVAERPWWRGPHVWVLTLFVVVLHGIPMTMLTFRGEETRRAQVAVEILRSGDWIVPRLQGEFYLSRPPMGSWSIAVVGWLRGEVDHIAARLPSVIAIWLTTLLVYGYSRQFLNSTAAFLAAISYPSMMLVLQLGRTAETEAQFTFYLGASMLLWHLGYRAGWSGWKTWAVGYTFAAFAGLTKGPQGLVYFVSIVGVYLLFVRRDWKFLFSRGHVVGGLTFVGILAAWQVPYYLNSNWDCVVGIWTKLASQRFTHYNSVFIKHLVSYPLEIAACALPWSPFLLQFANPKFYKSLGDRKSEAAFLWTCLLVTFPSVWFAPYALGRYYMPLFPVLAVLFGIVLDRLMTRPEGMWMRNGWRWYAVGAAFSMLFGAGVLTGVITGGIQADWADALRNTIVLTSMSLGFLLLGAVMLWLYRDALSPRALQVAILLVAVCCSFGPAITIVDSQRRNQPDIQARMAEVKSKLPANASLVSYGPLHHAFLFHFGEFVPRRPWPTEPSEAAETEYFCLHERESKTHTLPFPWEPVAVISCEGHSTRLESRTVIGRRLDLVASTPTDTAR